MKQSKTLFDLICEVNLRHSGFRISKQFIVDYAVNEFQKLLTSKAVMQVCEILLDIFSDCYSIEENLRCAIEDYIDTLTY